MANESMLEAENARRLDWFPMSSFYFRSASSSYSSFRLKPSVDNNFWLRFYFGWSVGFWINHIYLKELREKRHRLVLYVNTESRRNRKLYRNDWGVFWHWLEQGGTPDESVCNINMKINVSLMICLEWLNRRLSFTGSCFSLFLLIE